MVIVRKIFKKKISSYLYILPSLLIILVIEIYPLVYSFRMSLNKVSLLGLYDWEFVGLANYVKIVSDSIFKIALVNTTYLCIGGVTLSMVIGLGIALLVNKMGKGKTVFRTVFLLPVLLSPILTGIVWKYMYDSTLGIINYFLGLIGIPAINWLTEPSLALLSIMVTDIWQWSPYAFIVFLAGLESLPPEPYEAAQIDGASSLQLFIWLTLPFLKPLLLIVAMFRVIFTFRMFDIVYALTLGGPGTVTETLSLYIWRTSFRSLNIGYGASLSFVMLGIILGIGFLVVRKLSKELLA